MGYARVPVCMWGYSFISALGCSYLCLACSLLGLLLPVLFFGLWTEKEVQTLLRELCCPPGQFRDVPANLGPSWEMQSVPAVPAAGTYLGPVRCAYRRWAPWWNPGCGCQGLGEQRELGEALAGLSPMLRSHHSILDLPALISQPTSYPSPALTPFLHQEGRKGWHNLTSLQVSAGPIRCFETCKTVLQELEELPSV